MNMTATMLKRLSGVAALSVGILATAAVWADTGNPFTMNLGFSGNFSGADVYHFGLEDGYTDGFDSTLVKDAQIPPVVPGTNAIAYFRVYDPDPNLTQLSDDFRGLTLDDFGLNKGTGKKWLFIFQLPNGFNGSVTTQWDTSSFSTATFKTLRMYQVDGYQITDNKVVPGNELASTNKDMLSPTTGSYTISSSSGVAGFFYCVIEANTLTYTAPDQQGSVTGNIDPSEIRPTAQWKLTGINSYASGWKLHGETLTDVPLGSCTVTFSDVIGYNTPAPQTFTLTSTPATRTGIYTAKTLDQVMVTISPSAVAGVAHWELSGGQFGSDWLDSGTAYRPTEWGARMYMVRFEPVTGWTKPADIGTYNDQTGLVENGVLVAYDGDEVLSGATCTYSGVVASPTSIVTTEAGGSSTVSVWLSTQPTGDVTVTPTLTDFTGAPPATIEIPGRATTLTFTNANWSTPQTIEIIGADDVVPNGGGGRTYKLTLTAASGDARYNTLARSPVSGFTVDDDVAGLLVSPMVGLVTTEAAGPGATFNVRLATQPTTDVVVDVASANTNEGTVDKASLTFRNDNWDDAQTVTITGQQDVLVDGDIPYTVTLIVNNAQSDDAYDNKSAVVSVTNLDDDGAAPPAAVDQLTYLPDGLLEFGQVYTGQTKVMTVTVVNGESSSVTITAGTPGGSAFGVKSGSSYVAGTPVSFTIAAGKTASVKVQFTAQTDGTVSNDTLTFIYNDGTDHTINTIALHAVTVAPLDGGTLFVKQPVIVAKQGAATRDITFNIDLNTADPNGDGNTADGVTYMQLGFAIQFPAVVQMGSVVVTTNTSRTGGIPFATLPSGQVMAFDYVDSSNLTGISAANGSILTITATVDTSGIEADYPIDLYAVTSYSLTGTYDIRTIDATLSVSSNVVIATLDVNASGDVLTNDLILIYRKINLYDPFGLPLLPAGMILPDGVTEAQVIENIENLQANGLDVNQSGDVLTNDLILIYRKINLYDPFGLPLLPSGMVLPDGVTEQDVLTNIEGIQPVAR